MKFTLRTALFAACVAFRLAAAADPAPPSVPISDDQKKLEEAIRIRLAEHAWKKASKAVPASATTATPPAPGTPVTTASQASAPATPATAATTTPPKDEPALQLPRVEVNQSRITELAIELHEKDLEIAREKKNTKPTVLDTSLNDPEASHALAIFGGSSSEDRARLAQERVSLLEAEKDLIEEIAQAPTKEEREELNKTLNDLKAMRRELERAPKDIRGE